MAVTLSRFVAIHKALADPNRVRALLACRRRELCVCEITDVLGLAPSTVSRHLAVLRQAGLLESRKRGRWIYCRLPGGARPRAVRDTLDRLIRDLARDPRIAADRKRLEELERLGTDALCARRRCGTARGK